jgi:pimeloyl-ACP methyl ester carboxylesterase
LGLRPVRSLKGARQNHNHLRYDRPTNFLKNEGDTDAVVPPLNQLYYLKKIPRAEYITYPGEGHMHIGVHFKELIEKLVQ